MSFGALQKPNVGGLGAGVRPMPEMAGMAKAGTAVSGVQRASGAMIPLQNEPFHAGSGLHPGIETGYGLTSGYGDEYGTMIEFAPSKNASRYKPAETFTTSELKELQVEYDRQEAIRKNKLNKLQELATMGDDRQATAPRPQMVGAGSGMRGFTPIASGPLEREKDILDAPFLQGLYS